MRRIQAVSANPGAVRSDIWRNVPPIVSTLYDYFMRIFYLTTDQGASASIFAALCKPAAIEKWRRSIEKNQAVAPPSLKWSMHKNLPYVVPYDMPIDCLGLEMIGIFAGPRFSKVSLPQDSATIASDMWTFSERIISENIASPGGIKKKTM